jgi:NAD(P)-dependent dehydrogenase (short-subunit alcohol dehydrogenase family)
MRGIPNTAAYGTSKAAVVALTKLMALDHAADAIRVNCVCPGLIETDNSRRYTEIYAAKHGITVEETMRRVLRHYPLGRVGKPLDVANAVLFLASDEAAWITGENLNVDGGRGAGTDEEDL